MLKPIKWNEIWNLSKPLKVAHSIYKQEINLVLISVYKVNYPKHRSINMPKTNLRLVFSSNFNFIRVHSLTQELVKACWLREVVSIVLPNFSTRRSLCQKDNQKLKNMVSVLYYTAQVQLKCNEKRSRYSDVLTSANLSRSFQFT